MLLAGGGPIGEFFATLGACDWRLTNHPAG